MQGVAILTDPEGKPSVLVIDLKHLDPVIVSLVEALLDRIRETDERNDWWGLTPGGLDQAYGKDEPKLRHDGDLDG